MQQKEGRRGKMLRHPHHPQTLFTGRDIQTVKHNIPTEYQLSINANQITIKSESSNPGKRGI